MHQLSVSKKNICRYWILLGIAVAWTLFIWSNSLRDGAESTIQSDFVTALLNGFMDTLQIPVEYRTFLVRKAAHMGEFCVLGICWSCFFAGRKIYWPLVFSLVTAFCDEGIQYFIPGRSNQLRDVMIDFAGACIGVLLVRMIQKLKQDKK